METERRGHGNNERDASCIFPKEQELQTLRPRYASIPRDCRFWGHWEYEASGAACKYLARTHHRPYYKETGSDAVQSIGAIVNETKGAIEEQNPQN